MKIKLKKIPEFLSHIIVENIPLFIIIGILNFFDLGDLRLFLYKVIMPLVIAYTSGAAVEKKYGGITAVIIIGGVLSRYNVDTLLEPVFIGALSGFAIKKYHDFLEKYKFPGFEMLLNNLGVAFISLGLVIILNKVLPFYEGFRTIFYKNIISNLFKTGYLPLYSIIIEPAKVLFMNNFVNHGIFSVLGLSELNEKGKSIFFLLETNPGPGMGLLLAYFFREKEKKKKKEALSNIFIQSIGGIHEVYFPYVLRNLRLILPLILGGMSGIFLFSIFDSGLMGVASPGSIFLITVLTPAQNRLTLLLAVAVSASVTFFLSYIMIRQEDMARDKIKTNESKKLFPDIKTDFAQNKNYNSIYIVCDAGMGSSAMGATFLRRKLEKAGLKDINVGNCSIDKIKSENPDIIIVHRQLLERVKKEVNNAEIVIVDDFLDPKPYDLLVEKTKNYKTIKNPTTQEDKILEHSNIELGLKRIKKEEALKKIGESMIQRGYVEPYYLDSIFEREKISNTYLDNGIAIPHGTFEGKVYIKKTGIVIHQYPYGIDFENGNTAYVLIGIAALEDEHTEIISKIADIVEDEKLAETLTTAIEVEEIYKILCLEDDRA
ncbi:PTS sugar transporter subunit IIA [Ilyobacter polytropus]|uniref:Phosphoenolpyruvate-dependent sugar phosphotransferase system EIIA 2 n=1 Tax=Ilyobacter polytropus (strain ATCC 51220 / DSM 2926 / LMG 16218 / CuHBu1) TaxID=572544 RepID=E3H9C8_ILYPC|nr:PTS sugar transporter subunit IIA [Ilyobacter polytropus]ADO83037.1 phosphoenolpyruvate-dependent sugar phosphotransferase system EIIA 2 [Ilyobacter polytropus DSM 2926]